MANEYKIPYINACIRAFARRFGITNTEAFNDLNAYEGINFLDTYYEIEHLESIEDAVDDLTLLCKKNGGTLGA